ncbi:MAG: hypothetical protein COB24_11855 [Hyphomicrobiales bacterium]|nr:MAG: hypothetical protein COB24_11855 [Hyphomicrobiales bacterium]
MSVRIQLKQQMSALTIAIEEAETAWGVKARRGTVTTTQKNYHVMALKAAFNNLAKLYELPEAFVVTLKELDSGNLTN